MELLYTRAGFIEGRSVRSQGLLVKASIVDLRYHMNKVLRALERNEDVCILSRGKLKGVIKAVRGKPQIKVCDHPFFNMLESPETVDRPMERLRGGWYRDL
jgi:hypothetical protein